MANNADDFRILKLLTVQGIPTPAPTITFVSWQPPPSSWIKANIDGSALVSPSAAGASCIFITSAGFPRGFFSFSVGQNYVFMAELKAAIHAVNSAWQKGWHNIWIECDSSYVVRLLHDKSLDVPWKFRSDWQ